jgi:hypothetical protein
MSQQEQVNGSSLQLQEGSGLWSSPYTGGDSPKQLDVKTSISEALSNYIGNPQAQAASENKSINNDSQRILNSPLVSSANPFAGRFSPRLLSRYMDNLSLDNNNTIVSSNVQKTVWQRINEREQRTIDELKVVNERLREINILKTYPLGLDELFRNEQEIDDHPEEPTPALFEKLDKSSEEDRSKFAMKLLNKRQIDNILLSYELRYLEPAVKLPFNDDAVIEKAIYLLARYQWIGGGVDIDDNTWGIHRRSEEKPLSDISLTNTIDYRNCDNTGLEEYLEDFCLLLDRHFEGCDARYDCTEIAACDRSLVIININHVDTIAERKRLRKFNIENNITDDDSNSDSETSYPTDEEQVSKESSDDASGNSDSSQSEDDTRDL